MEARSLADRGRLAILVLPALLCTAVSVAQVNVLTVNYDRQRTNANLNETTLKVANVDSKHFGKLFSLPVDGQVYAQPLYVSNLEIPDKGFHNVLYVATMHNTVYAFDADAASADGLLWSTNLGPAVPAKNYSFHDIEPEVGILSTPVIDLKASAIYVVADTLENGFYTYRLHALDLATGVEKFNGPAVLFAQARGTGDDSHNGIVTFEPAHHLQRPGLLLLNGVIYIAFGSHGDARPFHGWFLGYDATDVQRQVTSMAVTPNGAGGAIWQAGRGPAADALGNIYVVTANGDFDGITDFGESILRLHPRKGMSVDDWFTPDEWSALNDDDDDLGSCGPLLVPGTNLLLGGGKDGRLFVVHRNTMGRLQSGNLQVAQSFGAIGFGIFNMALWNRSDGPLVYLQGLHDSVRAYRMNSGRFDTEPVAISDTDNGIPYQGMAVSAAGDDPDSGILWISSSDDVLHAYAAADVSRELWNSDMNPDRDALGSFAKFAAPTVANGKVYVPTFAGRVMVYGLLPEVDSQ